VSALDDLCFLFVNDWVGVHREDAFPQESLVFVLDLHQVDAALQVGFEGLLVRFGVLICVVRSVVEQIEGNVIAREKLIARMYLLVDAASDLCEDLCLGHFREFVQPGVDARKGFVVDASLLSEDASLHVVEVVLLRLLERRIVPLHLELLRLEVVTGIVLVADTERHEVELLESLYDRAFARHREHLQQGLLCLVATVLGSALALRYPNVLVLLLNGIVHVAAHLLTAFEEFSRAQSPFDRKGFIELDERLNPRIDEKIIANRNLASRREFVLVQHQVEDSAVEHDVAMVADERVTLRPWLNACVSKGVATAALAEDALQDGLDEPQLKLQRTVHANEGQAYQAVSHPAWHPRHKALQHPRELPVGKETLDGLLHLTLCKGADIVKFIMHFRVYLL